MDNSPIVKREIISINKMYNDHFEYIDYEDYSVADFEDDGSDFSDYPNKTSLVCTHCSTGYKEGQEAIIHFNTECGKKLGLKAKSMKNKNKKKKKSKIKTDL